MNLEINSERLIREIQHDFNNAFPFLKIEFFVNGNGGNQSSSTKKRISSGMRVNETPGKHVDLGIIEIGDQMTVSQLEKTLREQLGLIIQVFRKSGNIWLETTMTDNWTLKQQNEHGKEISTVPMRHSNISDLERPEGD